ncbi:hypothetical protein HMPREF1556_01472 [Porphyromonas sp. oral taxon 278 str. W7784]|nr:hypothetical protein HMPREF1556_01472 [Porphyromonas sp. oral taxon 278 str. W7784]
MPCYFSYFDLRLRMLNPSTEETLPYRFGYFDPLLQSLCSPSSGRRERKRRSPAGTQRRVRAGLLISAGCGR